MTTLDDPQLKLLNLESSSYESKPPHHARTCFSRHHNPGNIDTDFVVEPWDDNSAIFVKDEPAPKCPASVNKEKGRMTPSRTPVSRVSRQRSIETPCQQRHSIARPTSCHHSTFTDLGIKPPSVQYSKVVEKMFEASASLQNPQQWHKSPRKNSTGQYRQICLKNILYARKVNPSHKVIKVAQKSGQSFSWSDYYKYIQQQGITQKNKSVTMIGNERDSALKNFRLKLKTLSIKQNL